MYERVKPGSIEEENALAAIDAAREDDIDGVCVCEDGTLLFRACVSPEERRTLLRRREEGQLPRVKKARLALS